MPATQSLDLPNLEDPAVALICAARGIRRLALFGSRLKGTNRPDSDIDLLVEFEPGRVPGLLALSAIEIELAEVLGRKVDLRTAQDLSRHFRDEVLRSARTIYAVGHAA
ncbi:MAG: nucleotidyltransferase family protein [Burkholderiales bacterium]|nr:nucleotidyltransferase family protein [Burkholderiales bacterium]